MKNVKQIMVVYFLSLILGVNAVLFKRVLNFSDPSKNVGWFWFKYVG